MLHSLRHSLMDAQSNGLKVPEPSTLLLLGPDWLDWDFWEGGGFGEDLRKEMGAVNLERSLDVLIQTKGGE